MKLTEALLKAEEIRKETNKRVTICDLGWSVIDPIVNPVNTDTDASDTPKYERYKITIPCMKLADEPHLLAANKFISVHFATIDRDKDCTIVKHKISDPIVQVPVYIAENDKHSDWTLVESITDVIKEILMIPETSVEIVDTKSTD